MPVRIQRKRTLPPLAFPERCPWNPFPHDSDWGRKFEEMHRRDLARQRFRRMVESADGNN